MFLKIVFCCVILNRLAQLFYMVGLQMCDKNAQIWEQISVAS